MAEGDESRFVQHVAYDEFDGGDHSYNQGVVWPNTPEQQFGSGSRGGQWADPNRGPGGGIIYPTTFPNYSQGDDGNDYSSGWVGGVYGGDDKGVNIATSPTNTPKTGGSSRGGSSPLGSSKTTTSKTTYAGAAPTMGAIPTLQMPKIDKRRIRALSQEISAPAVRKLREGLQGAMNISTDNPNVRRMTLREALQGYGTGLESAMAGAGGQARAEHQQEVNLLAIEAQANWRAQTEKIAAEYNNAYQTYLKSGTTTSTSTEGVGGAGDMVVRLGVWGNPIYGPAFSKDAHRQ